jgi:formylglycine-generating enzyme
VDEEVEVEGFRIDRHEVTVARFREFVEATGFVTEAEKYGWSGVFRPSLQSWEAVEGADWKYPEGPQGRNAKDEEPVTQVSWNDAVAYAEWAGKRLPTETEWLFAASVRGKNRYFSWGDGELQLEGRFPGNWWQGIFPYKDSGADGFLNVAPVGSFLPNELGLYDMAGNVWEWTSTVFRENPAEPHNPEMIIKGGSFLCAANYCAGYRLKNFQQTPKDSGLNHLGFRCVR